VEVWSHGSHHVVEVHDNVNKGVDNSNEGAMTPRVVLSASPRDHRHHCVVIHVQECNLSLLLP